MCGIFGILVKKESDYNSRFLSGSIRTLSKLSQNRGKDSSGICVLNNLKNEFDIIKGPISASELMKRKSVKKRLKFSFSSEINRNLKLAFGHARLVTNGSQLNDSNNQPVVKDDIICIHNGIVVNADDLWEKNNDIIRDNEIDTEIIPALVRKKIKSGMSTELSVKNTLDQITGTASVALSFSDINKFILASNNGSLYLLTNNKDIIFFCLR